MQSSQSRAQVPNHLFVRFSYSGPLSTCPYHQEAAARELGVIPISCLSLVFPGWPSVVLGGDPPPLGSCSQQITFSMASFDLLVLPQLISKTNENNAL